MADNGSSGMTGIVAIVAIVIIVLVGYFVWQNSAAPADGDDASINVDIPDGESMMER